MSDAAKTPMIHIMPRTMSVFEVLRKIERGSIDLSPDFQRNFVWDPVRQSRLVESVLLKIPLPVFYLDATTEERWQVVDGLQRLSSLRAFRETGALHLQGLQILPDLNGAGFHNLPRWQQQIFEDAQLHLITIEPGTHYLCTFNHRYAARRRAITAKAS